MSRPPRPPAYRSILVVTAFLLVVLSGLWNLLSHSWSPFFRLNLFLHPILGTVVAAGAIRMAATRLRARVPGLSPSLLLAFIVLVFLGFFKSFVFLRMPIAQSNAFSAVTFLAMASACAFLYLRGRKVSLSGLVLPGSSAEAARFVLWSIGLASGLSILLAGGGRSAFALAFFHAVTGILVATIGILGTLLDARKRGWDLARAAVLTAALALAVPAMVNLVGRSSQPAPARTKATIHLSTIPLDKRLPEERDPVPFPIDSEWFDITASCGATPECHPDLLADHRRSTHNLSYQTPHMQKNLALLASEIGRDNQVLCAGCHTPSVLFTGGGRTEDYARRDNMSCVFCHVISEVAQSEDPRKSSYSIDLPVDHLSMFLDAEREGGVLGPLNDLLIRLNPAAHGRAFKRPLYAEDRYCMACHHLQLKGIAPGRTCVQCHMEPRTGIGMEGKAKNHLFPGSNTVIPSLLGFPDTAEVTGRWMRGEFLERALGDPYGTLRFPAVTPDAERIADFKYLDMSVEADGSVTRGAEIRLRILTNNVGIAHGFPSSALDLEEAWLAVRVTDETGRLLFESGGLDAEHRLLPGAHRMGGHMIGLDGHVVTNNRIWQVRKKVIDRMILPREVGIDVYTMTLPPDCGRFLNVEAAWRYRKLNQDYWTWAYGPGTTSPAPVVVRTMTQFPIGAPSGDAGDPQEPSVTTRGEPDGPIEPPE